MSNFGNRPPSGSLRPGTKGRMAQGSNMAKPPGTGMVPGSARPGTRGGDGGMGALNSQIRVTDRPMTRQGLGIATGAKGPQRQVQDKSYFMGLLRAKVSELTTEIARMQKDIDKYSQEHETYLTYEKRAESLASEIKDFQGQLADYNTLLDKLNTDSDMDEIIQEHDAIKVSNERERKSIDELFMKRQQKEEQIKDLQLEIDQENRMAENLVQGMSESMKQNYLNLKKKNANLQKALDEKQQLLDKVTTKLQTLEEEVASSPVKQEAVTLYEKIHELEEKKQSLVDEANSKGTPTEEREKLLKQVKDDNEEIRSIEKRIQEIKEKIRVTSEELQHVDMDLEENQGERNQKYLELKKREETMQEFLDSFEENKKRELERKAQLEGNIVSVMEHMSRRMIRSKHLPSVGELKQMQADLSFKENEMHRSQNTSDSLQSEHDRLQMDLDKVQQLETKISSELEVLKTKVASMEQELVKYYDLDTLKENAEDRRVHLNDEQEILESRRETSKGRVRDMSQTYEALKNKLNENETYSQLANLERKWQHHEQNNFVMQEFIATKSVESDYGPLKEKVTSQLDEINKMIIGNLGK
ncbi:intraflagellar transport protein 74 homolog isoform X2 [Dendronephthya gigantea]|uniref:intraflagellar transport protein 74 homolog isoform X2 n=1 Tax=Dendronephthya gigantea TaxID=151771 RepID=UPI00106CCCC3|nr:intraflagellar transport protein 74 homolog isoform X2 [Dendronephthya gigantea]